VGIRGLVMTLLYEKSLKLNCNIDANEGVGTATNLMSNDTEQLFLANLFTHYTWLSPTFVLIIFSWMCVELVSGQTQHHATIRFMALINATDVFCWQGWAAVVGFGLLLVSIPLNGWIGKKVGVSKRDMVGETDDRTNFVSQILNGIHVVKMSVNECVHDDCFVATKDLCYCQLAKITDR
jgi:hypothetical protein